MSKLTLAPIAIAALTMGFATPRTASAATPQLVQHITDPATGAVVIVTRQGPKEVTLQVTSGGLLVRRRLTRDKVETLLKDGKNEVTVTNDLRTMVVRAGGRAVRIVAHDERAAVGATSLLAKSAVVARAIDLLGRLRLPAGQPAAVTLQFTRTFLLDMSGNRAAALAGYQALRAGLQTARIVHARFSDSPTDCWNSYVREAIEAANELVDCQNGLSWWDWFGEKACEQIYTLRAMGALSW